MLLAAVAAAMMAPLAVADTVEIAGNMQQSTENLGSYCGSVCYEFQGDGTGLLSITLKNRTDEEIGGFLTGFLFNINSDDPDASAEYQENAKYPDFEAASGSGEPFGDFDAGAALGGNFLGGGNPNGGVPVGAETTFEFIVTADDAETLTALDFLTGPNEYNFIVRFRGMDESTAGSDKVPARCPADFNGDGVIDGADLGPILSFWGGPPGPGGLGDATCDGIVDVEDLRKWLTTFGPCPF